MAAASIGQRSDLQHAAHAERSIISDWRDANPLGTQAEFRAWCTGNGIEIARGYICDVFREWEAGQPQGISGSDVVDPDVQG